MDLFLEHRIAKKIHGSSVRFKAHVMSQSIVVFIGVLGKARNKSA